MRRVPDETLMTFKLPLHHQTLRHVELLVLALGLVASVASAEWTPGGSRLGNRDDIVIGGDGRGGLFGWAGYPTEDSQYRLTSDGDTLPGWSVSGKTLVPGNRRWADHESMEPVCGLPDREGGAFVLLAEQGPFNPIGGYLDPQRLYVHRRTASGGVSSGWDAQGVHLASQWLGHRFQWHHKARMVEDGRGGVIVCWMDEEQPYSRLVVQRVAGRGDKLWGADGEFVQRAADACTVPSIVADGRGGALVFWGKRDVSGAMHVMAQHVLASGKMSWGLDGEVVSSKTFDRLSSAIPADGGWVWAYYAAAVAAVPDGLGGAVISWSGSEGGDLNTYAARVTADGGLPWGQDLAVCSATGDQSQVVSIPWRAGGAIFGWRDLRSGTGAAFYAQAVTRNGRLAWSRDGVSVCAESGVKRMLQTVTDGRGGAYFAWLDRGRGDQVFAQHLSSRGQPTPGWAEDGVLVSKTATSWVGEGYDLPDFSTVDLVQAGGGEALLGWRDTRLGTLAMQLTLDGPSVPSASSASQAAFLRMVNTNPDDHVEFGIRTIGPNPAVGSATVAFGLARGGPASVEVLDLAGRRVWSRDLGELGAGTHSITVAEGNRLRGGVYFVRLRQGARAATARFVVVG